MIRYHIWKLREFLHIPYKQYSGVSLEQAEKDPRWTVIYGDFEVTKKYQVVRNHYITGRLKASGCCVIDGCVIRGES